MSANKVTYVSLSADDPAIDAGFTAAIADARAGTGALAPLRVAGATRAGVDGGAIESRNPADTRMVVARVATRRRERAARRRRRRRAPPSRPGAGAPGQSGSP